MKCNKCNHENVSGATFCEQCGNSLIIETKNSANIKTGEFCSSCGAKIAENAMFCAECGAQQDIICGQCNHSNPVGALFCQNCAKPLPVVCPKCKTLNKPGAIFCENCGVKTTGQTKPVIKLIRHPAFIAAASVFIIFAFTWYFTLKVTGFIKTGDNKLASNDFISATESYQQADDAFLSFFYSKTIKSGFETIKEKRYNLVSQNINNAKQAISGELSDDLLEESKNYMETAEQYAYTQKEKDLVAALKKDYDYKYEQNKAVERFLAAMNKKNYGNRSSSHSSSASRCKTVTSVKFEQSLTNGCLTSKSLSVTDPTYNCNIYIDNYYLTASIGGNCVAGTYNFKLSYVAEDCILGGVVDSRTVSGSFSIDGTKSTYYVNIYDGWIDVKGY
jgi:ribosomal protein L40E